MKKISILLLGFLFLAFSVTPIIAGENCSKSDIEIINWYTERSSIGTIWIYGELRNNCKQPININLQVLVRDEKDKLIDSKDFWVAGSNNIPPGETWPIKAIITRKPDAKKFSIRIIRIRT